VGFVPVFVFLSTIMWIYVSTPVDKITDHYPWIRHRMLQRDPLVEFKREKPSSWTALADISKYAKWSIIVKEDWAFYQHKGLDFKEILIALKESFDTGKRLRGASTISQQVVKNLFLSNERSFWRKFKEAVFTYQLEQNYSKDKILEIYLNIINFGDGSYGIKRAADHYFIKSPSKLTPKESAFLASIMPNPDYYNYSFDAHKLTDYIKFEIDRVLIKLRQANIYKEEDRLEAVRGCFDWEDECELGEMIDRLSARTLNPAPIKGGASTHKRPPSQR
jgi:membrane peptidoglycan carboxypeptidase